MRRFKASCKDSRTDYEIVLSECSYNQACAWLYSELEKENAEVQSATILLNGLTQIKTQKFWKDGLNGNIRYLNGRTFYYDEERGYLLGE